MLPQPNLLLPLLTLFTPFVLGAPQAAPTLEATAAVPNVLPICIRGDLDHPAPLPAGWKEECDDLWTRLPRGSHSTVYSGHPGPDQVQAPAFWPRDPFVPAKCKMKIELNTRAADFDAISDFALRQAAESIWTNCIYNPMAPADTINGYVEKVGVGGLLTLTMGVASRPPFDEVGVVPSVVA